MWLACVSIFPVVPLTNKVTSPTRPSQAITMGIGLGKGAVAAVSRVRIAITGVLRAGRLKLYPGGVYGRRGGLVILGSLYI